MSCNAEHEIGRVGAYRAVECPLVAAVHAYVLDLAYVAPQPFLGLAGVVLICEPGGIERLLALGVVTAQT